MRQQIKFFPIKTVQEMENLKKFAQTFEHDIVNYNHKVYETWKDGKLIGFVQVFNVPTAFVAAHPDLSNPRDTLEIVNAWRSWAHIQHGEGWAGVNFSSKTFTPEVMQKLGFKRLETELYSI